MLESLLGLMVRLFGTESLACCRSILDVWQSMTNRQATPSSLELDGCQQLTMGVDRPLHRSEFGFVQSPSRRSSDSIARHRVCEIWRESGFRVATTPLYYFVAWDYSPRKQVHRMNYTYLKGPRRLSLQAG
ncbi:hypothetical protein B0T13DRAFT_76340 [Neurospora crassa]|nr:hypothetical protein B0T13DRAFT_76340 [Neurospora crassa]